MVRKFDYKVPAIEKFLDLVYERNLKMATDFVNKVWPEIKNFDHNKYPDLSKEKVHLEHEKRILSDEISEKEYAISRKYKDEYSAIVDEAKKRLGMDRGTILLSIKYFSPSELKRYNAINKRESLEQRKMKEIYNTKSLNNQLKQLKVIGEKAREANRQWKGFATKNKFINLMPELRYASSLKEALDLAKEWAKMDRKYLRINLYSTTENYVGKIVDMVNISFGANGSLNGIVIGETGKKAKVETIIAGGYNVQCLHCRVLVHSL